MQVTAHLEKQRNQLLIGALAFLMTMLFGNMLHESGHAAICAMYGGIIHTDFFSFVGCGGTAMSEPLSLMAIRLAGGLVAASTMSAIAIAVLRSNIPSSIKTPLLFAVVVGSLAHWQMAFLEAFANEIYVSISSGMIYVMGAMIAVPVCYFGIERRFSVTKKFN